jgi:putative transposase
VTAKCFHPLLALIASSTESELAKYVEYLKEENRILRDRLPNEVHTRKSERERLLKLGKLIGRAIEELITIVTPATFYRWVREEQGGAVAAKPKGGQRKPRELRELVIEIAKTTGFGYTRIIGELRKLGIRKISRQTVRRILKEEGIEPGPNRTTDSWAKFVERHRETLWATDFFSVRTMTTRGICQMYVLVFLCLETRDAIVTPSTEHPNSAWVVEQTEQFLEETGSRDRRPEILIHDMDTKFTQEFKDTLVARGVRPHQLPKVSPNLNGRCERFIQTIKHECLSKFIIFGRRHLDYLLAEFTAYYNSTRSSMVRDHLPPIREVPAEVELLKLDQVTVRRHVGGLVSSFERKAA